MTDLELLSAYIDEELEPSQIVALESRLATDKELADLLATLRGDDEAIRAAFSEVIDAPVPDRFLEAIDKGLAAPKSAEIIDFGAKLAAREASRSFRWLPAGAAIAATLVAGFFGLSQFDNPSADEAIEIALSNTLSGQSVILASGEKLTPQLSFAAKGGGYCRQFTLETKSSREGGLGCSARGKWSVEQRVALGAQEGGQDDGFAPVSGSEPELEEMIDKRRAGDPIDLDAERALIAKGWK